uniref:NAD-dependent epimerase/dehydratase domain-containing protein n=1 Tax=Fagus sylvatica TaxID=28930 RepID=A0A2N9FWJ0_FAGSY
MAKEGEVVCVTGGSGCIGSWLVHEPLDRGYTVQATVQDQRNVGFSTVVIVSCLLVDTSHVPLQWVDLHMGHSMCLRNTTASDIYKSISMHKVTHMCCAPIIFNIRLDQSEPKQRPDIKSPVQIVTGGAPPPASLLEQIKPLGFHVTHVSTPAENLF